MITCNANSLMFTTVQTLPPTVFCFNMMKLKDQTWDLARRKKCFQLQELN